MCKMDLADRFKNLVTGVSGSRRHPSDASSRKHRRSSDADQISTPRKRRSRGSSPRPASSQPQTQTQTQYTSPPRRVSWATTERVIPPPRLIDATVGIPDETEESRQRRLDSSVLTEMCVHKQNRHAVTAADQDEQTALSRAPRDPWTNSHIPDNPLNKLDLRFWESLSRQEQNQTRDIVMEDLTIAYPFLRSESILAFS
jgi:hypothetical protein